VVRYLVDGGPRLTALLAELCDDLHSGRWNPAWPPIPPAFLDNVVSAGQSVGSGTAALA
jgi:hypothetical protein